MYYPISKKNVERENFGDKIRYYIKNSPGKTNSSREEKTDGWLGTTNDVSVYALGEYETKEEALEAIKDDMPANHKLVHVEDELRDSERWISRPDVSQDDATLLREGQIKEAEILDDLMQDLEDLYQDHGAPKRQYNGAYDTTTGGPASDDLFLEPHHLDPYGDAPDWAKAVSSKYNGEMEQIVSALDLSYPRYYTTPEWKTFKEEATKMVEAHGGFEDAIEWGEENAPETA